MRTISLDDFNGHLERKLIQTARNLYSDGTKGNLMETNTIVKKWVTDAIHAIMTSQNILKILWDELEQSEKERDFILWNSWLWFCRVWKNKSSLKGNSEPLSIVWMTPLDYYDALVWIVNWTAPVAISENTLLVAENGDLRIIKKDI